jgi:hypothetical protein
MRIQTNRVKIKEIISLFSRDAIEGEIFIAPRPLPRANFKFYIGFAKINHESKNYKLLSKIKNHSVISEEEYLGKVKEIEFFWQAPSKSV